MLLFFINCRADNIRLGSHGRPSVFAHIEAWHANCSRVDFFFPIRQRLRETESMKTELQFLKEKKKFFTEFIGGDSKHNEIS